MKKALNIKENDTLNYDEFLEFDSISLEYCKFRLRALSQKIKFEFAKPKLRLN